MLCKARSKCSAMEPDLLLTLADQQSGLSAYQVAAGNLPTNNTKVFGAHGEGFPVNWSPRYAAAWGLSADVDRFENFKVHDS